MHNWFNELLRPKYKDITFYVHNIGRFDAPFMIKNFSLYNDTDQGKNNPYYFEATTLNSDILKLVIKRKMGGKVRSVKLLGSLAVLPKDLRSLCRDYQIEISKSYFPYLFCNKYTLFYFIL